MRNRKQHWRRTPGGIRERERILRDTSLTHCEAALRLGVNRETVRKCRAIRKFDAKPYQERRQSVEALLADRTLSDHEVAGKLGIDRGRVRIMRQRRRVYAIDVKRDVGSANRWNEYETDLVRKMFHAGATPKQMSIAVCRSAGAVRHKLINMGLTRPQKNRPSTLEERETARELHGRGMSELEIARKLGRAVVTICYWISRGEKLRTDEYGTTT